MRRHVLILALAALPALAGCGLQKSVVPDTISLADRCAETMKQAMPFADIDIGDRNSAGVDIRTIVAKVSGTRTDAQAAPIDRDLAVECTYTDSVLTAFRWTRGGPPTR